MEPAIPEGWERDSETLYLHSSGVRIERRVYRNKEGWVLVPVDLDRPVVEFPPDADGLNRAFAAFAKGALGPPGDASPSKDDPQSASDDEEKPDEGDD